MSDGATPGAPGGAAPAAPAQAGTPAAGQQPGETAAQAEARRIKLRLDGREVDLDESEVVANYQKGRQSAQLLSKVEQRRQEALKAKAAADGLLNRLKTDPVAVLRELDVDIRGLSEKTILDEIKLEQMSPAERRAYELEKRVKQYEEEKRKAQEEQQSQAHEAEVAKHKDEFARLFVETMEATGLPKSSGRYVVPRMAQLYAQNEEAGLESTPEEMAAWVMKGLNAEHRGVLSGLKGEALLTHLGDDTVKEIQRAIMARYNAKRGKAGVQQPAAQQQAAPAQAPKDPRKGRWEYIEGILKGG